MTYLPTDRIEAGLFDAPTNPIAYGADPTGNADSTSAFSTAIAYVQAKGGGSIQVPAGHYTCQGGISLTGSNIAVLAKGAAITHKGSGPLLSFGQNTNATRNITWVGGTLIANPLGGTTDLVYVQNCLQCTVAPDLIQGGNLPYTPTSQLATNGIHVFARQGPVFGTYYCQFGGPTLITGCSGQAIYVDGWDSTANNSYANDNLWTNMFCQQNQVGIHIDGSQSDTWIGGDCETNVSYGLSMTSHPVNVRFFGLWLEGNNSSGEQITADTSTYAASQQSNTFRGTCGTTGTIAYWRQFEASPATSYFGGAQLFQTVSGGILTATGTANNSPVLDIRLATDTQPQFRVQPSGSGGALRWGPGGSTSPDCGFGRLGANTIGTQLIGSTNTVLQLIGGFNPANFGATQNGSLWMGSGVPSNTNGANGDFYFRTGGTAGTSTLVYFKASGAWTGIL